MDYTLLKTKDNAQEDAPKPPKNILDPRLQVQLHVFSHNGGTQSFCPERDGFVRSAQAPGDVERIMRRLWILLSR